ncbi:PIG-L family deacetylase [Paucihalobacter sp.]|uniref:PIG-L family deacetylase n=1 Tax=Paucihalobacter sp. TaxID=2850405 RepID=UPI002FE3E4E6
MQTSRLLVFSLFLCVSILSAQQPKKLSSSEIFESVQKLNVLASVLYIAAHPDDENTRLISYMSNQMKARTAYLSLTRGDGGQNLIGPELRELLGLIRSQELVAARRIDGGEQLFTRANDFGFSKHPDETLSIWNKNEVLSDVVWAIRTFKPDIIINRFDHRTAGQTHGHHTASAMLGMQAFDLANDKNKFPNQLQYTSTWQPKRIFFNTSWWFYGNQEDFDAADKSNMITFDVGMYYPLKGTSNNEVAALASSQHLSQGFGRMSDRGSQQEYIELLEGDALKNNTNIFEGIDTSWNRIEGGKAIGAVLNQVEANFNFNNPSEHLPQLVEAYQLLQKVEDTHWKTIKSDELLNLIEASAGLYLEATSRDASACPGEKVKLNLEVINRSNANITLKSLQILDTSDKLTIQKNLIANNKFNYNLETTIHPEANYTSAYWLLNEGTLGMYNVKDQTQIGQPLSTPALQVQFIMDIDDVELTFNKPVVYRYAKPEKGELYQPFEILPPATVRMSNRVVIFNTGESKQIEVTVKAHTNNASGTLSLIHPEGWVISPNSYSFEIENKNDANNFVFSVQPPKAQSEGFIVPIATIGSREFTKEVVEINYSHIPFQTVLLPSQTKVVRLDIQKRGNSIGYIEGAGDVVPESLRQIGYEVSIIKPEDINPDYLAEFDAIVVGIRAYNTIEALKFKQNDLLNYVANGGNLIVQYNTSRGVLVDNLAPYNLKLSRDRVTDETSDVRFVNPEHPVLNVPNKITKADFSNWTQERGLYFPDEWAKEFTPVLSMNDPNESPKEGSLLVAPYGKGYYVYTGLSFFREFPEGVSGAYRLFANMLSLGKTTAD